MFGGFRFKVSDLAIYRDSGLSGFRVPFESVQTAAFGVSGVLNSKACILLSVVETAGGE